MVTLDFPRLLLLLLLASSWIMVANPLTMEEFAIKEKNVLRLADDALHLAVDTEECGELRYFP